MHNLWDPLILSSIVQIVRPLHMFDNTLAPINRNPFTNILNGEDIHYHDLLVGLEIIMMRICVYFQNMTHEFVRIEDIFFGLSTDVRIEIAKIFTNRQGPFLKQRELYGSIPYGQDFLETLRSVFDLGRFEHIIVGGYLDN